MSETGEHQGRQGNRGPLQTGRVDPYEYDFDVGTKGRDLTNYQSELAAAPPVVYKPAPHKAKKLSDRTPTAVSAYSARDATLTHLARSNDPDNWSAAIKPGGAVKGAIVGGLLAGPIGAGIGVAATGFEWKWNDHYNTIASLPGHALEWLEANSDVPFSKLPTILKESAWDFTEYMAPEFAAMTVWLIKILKDDFDPTFTRVMPSDHWWQADKEVVLQRFEIFGSALDRTLGKDVNQMGDDARAKFYDSVEHLGMQYGGTPGHSTGLVGMNSNMSAVTQQIELARLGHLVGDRLRGHSISNDGITEEIEMFRLNENGDKEIYSKALDLKNRDDVAELARSVFLGSKYASLKIGSHDKSHVGPQENPAKEEERAQYRRKLSEKIAGIAAAARITDDQLSSMMGLPKGADGQQLYNITRNTSADPGHEHLQLEYRDPDGNSRRALLANEFSEAKLEITLQQAEVVQTIKEMREQGQDMSSGDMLYGVDFSEVGFKQLGKKDEDGSSFTIDRDNPQITVDPETLYVMANFTDGQKHKFMLDQEDLGTLHDNLRKREKLQMLEQEIDTTSDPVLMGAVVAAVGALTAAQHPGFNVSDAPKDGHHRLFAKDAEHPTDRLDHVLTETELDSAIKVVRQIKGHAQGAGGDAGGGKGRGKKGGGSDGGDSGSGDAGGDSGGGSSGGTASGGSSGSGTHAAGKDPVEEASAIITPALVSLAGEQRTETTKNAADMPVSLPPSEPQEREGASVPSGEGTKNALGTGRLDADIMARTAAYLEAMERGEELPAFPAAPEGAEDSRVKPGKTPATDKTPGGRSLN